MKGERSRDLGAWQSRLLEELRRDLGEPEPEAAEVARDSERTEILAFELAAEVYGVKIGALAEILLTRPATPLPRTPRFVKGVLTLRGAVVPVIDLALRLGLPRSEPTRTSRIVVLRDGEEYLGFGVDRVLGVVRFTDREVETSDFAAAVDPRFLEGIGYDRSDTLIAVLNSERLCEFGLEEA